MKPNKIGTVFLALLLILAPATACAATTASVAPQPRFTAVDVNGDPYVGAKLYTTETGTTTAKTTWTDSTKGTANDNPIILDSYGQADVWLDSSGGAYRFRLDDADDVTLWTIDGIESINLADINALIDADIATAIAGNVGTNFYYPDEGAADQGVTGGGATIKAYADTIGTFNAVMYFANDSGSATTPYKIDTNIDHSTKSNILYVFEPGAYLDQVGGTETLTVYSRDNILCSDTKIADGEVLVFAQAAVKSTSPELWGALRDGSTDDDLPLQYCINAVDAVTGTVELGAGTYICNTALSTDGSCTIKGQGFVSIIDFSGGGAINGISVGGGNTLIQDMKLIGSGAEAGEVHGVVVDANVDNVIIQRVWAHDWDDAGIRIGWDGNAESPAGAEYCKVLNNIVTDNADGSGIELIYAEYVICTGNHVIQSDTSRAPIHGIRVAGCMHATVSNNYINMADDASTKGITVQGGGDAGTIHRGCSDVIITGNQIEECVYGVVIRSQSNNVIISNNNITRSSGAGRAIWVYAANAGHSFAANDVSIIGNYFSGWLTHVYLDENSINIDTGHRFLISNNMFDDWGAAASGTAIVLDSGAKVLDATTIQGNTFRKSTDGGNGIRIVGVPTGVKICDNQIEMQTLSSGDYVIEITGAAKEVTIENNEFDVGSGDPDRFLGLSNLCNDIIFRNNSGMTLRTESAGATHVLEFDLADEAAYYCVVRCIATQSDFSDRNFYHLEGLFYRNGGGGATQEGATTDISEIESEANWDCVFGVSANTLRVTVDDNSGDTVDWHMQVELVSHRNT